MRIEVEPLCGDGVNTPFAWPKFQQWLGKEINRRTTGSQDFIKKYGKGWKLNFVLQPHRRIKHARVREIGRYRPDKEVFCIINVPGKNCKSPDPAAYAPWVQAFLEEVVRALRQMGFDSSKLEAAMPQLVKRFASDPKMIESSFLDGYVPRHSPEPPSTRPPSLKSKPMSSREPNLPKWKMPTKIARRVEEEDGMWEDERFDPILLTVLSGTEYRGREIPLAWQIEFDPSDDRLEAANERLKASGVEPDGDGWSDAVQRAFRKRYPKLARELHLDSESSACVLWVESERACKLLVGLLWGLMFTKR